MFPSTKKRVNRHSIVIDAPLARVGRQVIIWGEAVWWPKRCAMRFIRKTSGDLKVGTQFTQKVLLPWAPDWDVQVTKLIPESVIERTFLNGIFKGKETVRVVALEENKTKVDYVLEYEVQGFLNRLLWPVLFERLHNYNIEMILTALKKFALGKKK